MYLYLLATLGIFGSVFIFKPLVKFLSNYALKIHENVFVESAEFVSEDEVFNDPNLTLDTSKLKEDLHKTYIEENNESHLKYIRLNYYPYNTNKLMMLILFFNRSLISNGINQITGYAFKAFLEKFGIESWFNTKENQLKISQLLDDITQIYSYVIVNNFQSNINNLNNISSDDQVANLVIVVCKEHTFVCIHSSEINIEMPIVVDKDIEEHTNFITDCWNNNQSSIKNTYIYMMSLQNPNKLFHKWLYDNKEYDFFTLDNLKHLNEFNHLTISNKKK